MSESPWRLSWRADPAVAALIVGHYSRQTPDSPQFVPPGTCLVLKTAELNPVTRLPWAAWTTYWPLAEFAKHDWAGAWVNQLFHREGGPYQASDLITWAVAHTRDKWPKAPKLGIITMVDPGKIENNGIPGWCYVRAGWSHVGFTKADHLWVYQQLPDRRISRRSKPMPAAMPVPGSQMLLEAS